MVLDLEDHTGRYKRTLAALTASYGFVGLDFFAPVETPGDAALDGSVGTSPPIPNASVINIHAAKDTAMTMPPTAASFVGGPEMDRVDLGSNNMAVSGSHTKGAAIMANDQHLSLGIPNTWYRASIEWPDHKVTGVTLPGLPFVLAGSNQKIAWGWTVAYADMGDLVAISTELTADMYRAPAGQDLFTLERRKDKINVRGSDPVEIETLWSIWGPIVSDDEKGHLLAYQWVFDRPGGLDLKLAKLETAATLPKKPSQSPSSRRCRA